MSVSIDKGPDETADSRGVLANWLDDYTAGRCDRTEMQASFLEICRGNPEAPWDALALLDQYQRRGRVDAALARTLKIDIAQLVFGVVNQTEEDEEDEQEPEEDHTPVSEGASAEGTSDTTGTRWRKLMADRVAPGRAEVDFVDPTQDPTQFRRDFDPLTRPPQKSRSDAADGTAPSSILRDRYELLTILGRGTAGTVYKALDRHRAHLDPASQCVALRVLKPNYRNSPGALGELERQFHQAQSLSHPNIVSVFDLDRDGTTYFLVMELLEGELLADILARLDHRTMPRERALSIIGSVGAALTHAHRRGVVHSDLKPGNVMITSNGDVKVLDFGFVRRQAADPQRKEPWIGDPAIGGGPQSGTLAYASDERVNADAPEEGEDVYSLGCIAYELLSGQHPYGGRSAPLARAHGRDPHRISGLTNKQWNALRTALQWSRADRKIDVVELIAGLGCAEVPQRLAPPQEIVAGDNPRRLGAFARLMLLALLVAGAAALYWRGPWPMPRITLSPPDSTPAESQAVVEQSPIATAPPEAASSPPAAVDPATTASTPAVVAPPLPAPKSTSKEAAPAAASRAAPAAAKPAAGPGVIAFDKDTYVATESDGTVKLTVMRSGDLSNAASIQWMLLPNSAEAGSDFAAIGPVTERFAPGSRTVVLTVPLVSDALKESTELFLVEISADEGAALGELTRAAVILVDDD